MFQLTVTCKRGVNPIEHELECDNCEACRACFLPNCQPRTTEEDRLSLARIPDRSRSPGHIHDFGMCILGTFKPPSISSEPNDHLRVRSQVSGRSGDGPYSDRNHLFS